MNRSFPRVASAAIGALTVGALSLCLAGPATASHVLVEVTAPESGTVGDTVDLPVVAQWVDGLPIEGMIVDLYVRASFAGVVDDVALDRAVTDETGAAKLAFRPTTAGHNELRIESVSPDADEEEGVTTVAVDVADGEALHPPRFGLDIPLLNVGLVMGVLTTVWTILLGVAIALVAIARKGRDPETTHEVEST